MSSWTRIKKKFKYDHKLRLILDGLGRLGFRISPFILYVESNPINLDFSEQEKLLFEELTVSYFDAEDMKEIAKINRPSINQETLLKRLKEGHKCLGVKIAGKVAAFSWLNLQQAKWIKRPLMNDEAYLFDMYTLNEFRGKGLAPFLRDKVYKELNKLGRTKCYSYSSLLNRSSILVHEKLNAKRKSLILHLELFQTWERQYKLKDYHDTPT